MSKNEMKVWNDCVTTLILNQTNNAFEKEY